MIVAACLSGLPQLGVFDLFHFTWRGVRAAYVACVGVSIFSLWGQAGLRLEHLLSEALQC